ncbi:MAG: aminomethyl-transferring glycine dehydrogenase subunit GcvPB [Nitrososphaerota archaeon]|nr:aminomethyl-transferring glycine dehydrogenase subunit GcvPB [Nitrososphaerota archaeon]MDG6939982.1 aminomethyl-transferring glycine dehydrogenase subunit GcvPB [Nitrososphaerota archaeon]
MVFRQAAWDEALLRDLSRPGRVGYVPPLPIGEETDLSLPGGLLRDSVELPSLTELQVVRHFVRLSQMNYSVDTGMYPLGSCTMKFNPKLDDRVASNPRLEGAHPYQHADGVQGILSALWEVSEALARVAGMDRVSLLPAAGAQGEFAGVLMMKKYHEVHGAASRTEIIIPDSAHGTNPASAAMAGLDVITVPSDSRGMVDLDRLKGLVGPRTAGMMMTVPNTLGLFERDVLKISELVHKGGGLMYYDGANMNAILGRVRPGDLGFDVVHMNIHKTFSTPHGGGGPGAGPVGVKSFLADYLPVPLLEKKGGRLAWRRDLPHTIGHLKGGYGNTGVLVRALAYLLTLGPGGLADVSGQAVLASNYLLKKLSREHYAVPFAQGTPRKHEFVVSAKPIARRGGSALKVSKALLDEGVHSPTVYFPLIVEEALMVEPTESEPLENLDRFAESMNAIARTAMEEPAKLENLPKKSSIGNLDEARASHPLTLKLTWKRKGPGQ